MTTQPEALKIARQLETWLRSFTPADAAVELRRQNARIQGLEAENKKLREMLMESLPVTDEQFERFMRP
jgi:hypothetical protein